MSLRIFYIVNETEGSRTDANVKLASEIYDIRSVKCRSVYNETRCVGCHGEQAA